MIKHIKTMNLNHVTPMTDKAARFLNTFVGRTLLLSDVEWEKVQMEMAAHKCWVMGSR